MIHDRFPRVLDEDAIIIPYHGDEAFVGEWKAV